MKSLFAFANTSMTEKISLKAHLQRLSDSQLEVTFYFQGPLDFILWPPDKSPQHPQRQDELWKTTCLEIFYSEDPLATSPYVEINCSPCGDWNAYAFSGYRENMMPTSDIIVRLKEAHRTSDKGTYTVQITSSSPLPSLIYGLTAVIEFTNGEKSYWALAHSEAVPNFHAKEAWKGLATR